MSALGAGGLTRTFWRPKGSLTLAWTPKPGLDVSLKLTRTVGQLAFLFFFYLVEGLDADNELRAQAKENRIALRLTGAPRSRGIEDAHACCVLARPARRH